MATKTLSRAAAGAARNAAAGSKPASNGSPLVGTFIPGGTLGTVQGRGRTAEALPEALVSVLEQMRNSGGAVEAAGTAKEIDKLKRQITRWVKEQNDAGRPTDKGFRTLATNDKGQQTAIRYSVYKVDAVSTK